MPIPYVRALSFDYGEPDQLSPLVRRVIANNPGPFTYTGTGVYIIGKGEVAVIDPGPDLPEHAEALKRALDGETVTHVLVTHAHLDHSPLAAPLAAWAGAKTYAMAPPRRREGSGDMEEGEDEGFVPDAEIFDGWSCAGPGWTIRAITTPGHTSNHLCFALKEEHALFSGDHIMGWSTTIISPPDGDMGAYLRSLRKVQQGFDRIYPTHGAPITEDTDGFIDAYLQHREAREDAILAAMRKGHRDIPAIVAAVYHDVDKALHPAACHSVLAHMVELHRRGKISCAAKEPQMDARYGLSN